MKQLTNSVKNAGLLPVGGNDANTSELVEVSFLLSRSQMTQLANQAHRRGMTSAQFLRQCISSMCQSKPESI